MDPDRPGWSPRKLLEASMAGLRHGLAGFRASRPRRLLHRSIPRPGAECLGLAGGPHRLCPCRASRSALRRDSTSTLGLAAHRLFIRSLWRHSAMVLSEIDANA